MLTSEVLRAELCAQLRPVLIRLSPGNLLEVRAIPKPRESVRQVVATILYASPASRELYHIPLYVTTLYHCTYCMPFRTPSALSSSLFFKAYRKKAFERCIFPKRKRPATPFGRRRRACPPRGCPIQPWLRNGDEGQGDPCAIENSLSASLPPFACPVPFTLFYLSCELSSLSLSLSLLRPGCVF